MENRITVYSPLRVSFSGGGTDIEPFVDLYGSKLVNTTIDRGVTVTYIDDGLGLEVSSRDHLKTMVSNIHTKRGMPFLILRLMENSGIHTGRVIIKSDVPPGSGLGSSSALITAIVKLINEIKGSQLTPTDLGKASFGLEKDFFGITLGKQDPFAISIGGFKYMEIKGDSVFVSKFNTPSDFIHEIERNSLLVYTGRTRESSRVLMDQVNRMQRDGNDIVKHLKAIRDLSPRIKKAIESADIGEFSDVINEGWKIKKSMNENASNRHVDDIIERAMNSGAVAARLLGGGSQGFVYLLSMDGKIMELQRTMLEHSNFVIRLSFDGNGTRLLSKNY